MTEKNEQTTEENQTKKNDTRTTRSQYTLYKQKWGQSASCNEDNPDELQMKLSYYGELYELTGKFHAEAVADAELMRFKRKEREFAVANANPAKTDGGNISAKKRDYIVFSKTKKLQLEELEYRNEALRWEHARDSILQQINIMKRKQDVMMNMFNRTNTVNYGS